MKLSKSVMFTTLALASVLAFAQGTFSLRMTPQVDMVARYRLKADIDVAGVAAIYSVLYTEKITKVDANGRYNVNTTYTESKAMIGDAELPVDQKPTEMIRLASGETVEFVNPPADPTLSRMANLNAFRAPQQAVKVGDTWNYVVKADSNLKSVDMKADFKLEAEEQVDQYDTFKIKADRIESSGTAPASMKGYIWINKADGTIIKREETWSNIVMPEAPGPINAKVVIKREG